MDERIYLDNNASTPIDEEVLQEFTAIQKEFIGNSSSSHIFGQKLKQKLIASRQIVADYLGVRSKEVIFTSGATEALNIVIQGIFPDSSNSGHVITSDLEHPAVYNTIQFLEKTRGVSATFLSPGIYGAVTKKQVAEVIRPDTKLIALMAVNNETGVKTDIDAIAAIAEQHQIPFLVDGVALLGKESFTIPSGVTAFCASGHKIHAPKGVGIAFIKRKLKIPPLLHGGEHEFGLRAGTENVGAIVAFAKAVELLSLHLPGVTETISEMRDSFEKQVRDSLEDVIINGEGPRICNTSNLSFNDVEGETLLAILDQRGIAASHGSACASGALKPSHILVNMGFSADRVRSSVRFSFSRMNTQKEVDKAAAVVIETVNRLRSVAGASR